MLLWVQTSRLFVKTRAQLRSAVVNFLATLPDYHRQGLGKLLLDVCLQEAEKAQKETFLVATPAGSGLYRKLGFEEVDRIIWNISSHGREEPVTWLCMRKKPSQKALSPVTSVPIEHDKMPRSGVEISELEV
jgi:ribosomal protein S18 acetylase RimI-like enzyme